MSCYHPLTAFWTGNYTDNCKRELVIIHGDSNLLPIDSVPRRIRNSIKPYGEHITMQNGHIFLNQRIELACGQCIGCRIDYSKQWALRCMLEAKQWKDNIFLTLTYDDEHVPDKLIPEHLTKFLKDLRRSMDYHYGNNGIRFFACGEYGELYMRPHFHIILYNCPVPDKQFFKSYRGVKLFTSPQIEKIWGKGFISIGDVTFESCAYVARYVLKKQKGKGSAEYYENLGIVPEFVRMSRRPGIARDWYEAHKDEIYVNDEIFLSNGKGAVRALKPARYFDRLYDHYNPEQLEVVKQKRRICADLSRQNKMEQLRIDDRNEFLAREERLASERVSNVVRNKIKGVEKKC